MLTAITLLATIAKQRGNSSIDILVKYYHLSGSILYSTQIKVCQSAVQPAVLTTSGGTVRWFIGFSELLLSGGMFLLIPKSR